VLRLSAVIPKIQQSVYRPEGTEVREYGYGDCANNLPI